MNDELGQTWAVVLAAGEGSRLRTLTTTPGGIAVPKQFCSLQGGRSLLGEALARAQTVTAVEHMCVVVAQQHRQFWSGPLAHLPHDNVIVQPENRGTAIGILLALLHIMERDPEARILLLPSDHYVGEERVLARSLVGAIEHLKACRNEVILLGIEPEGVDPELGYIVPGGVVGGMLRTVDRFVEKPAPEVARQLIMAGALWNAFIVAARAPALLAMFMMRIPEIVSDLGAAVAHDSIDPGSPIAAAHVYRRLPVLDFSRDIAAGNERMLRALRVPACTWSDLGTPVRVAHTLALMRARTPVREEALPAMGSWINLAAQHAMLQ